MKDNQSYFTIFYALGYVVVIAESAKDAARRFLRKHPEATIESVLPGKLSHS